MSSSWLLFMTEWVWEKMPQIHADPHTCKAANCWHRHTLSVSVVDVSFCKDVIQPTCLNPGYFNILLCVCMQLCVFWLMASCLSFIQALYCIVFQFLSASTSSCLLLLSDTSKDHICFRFYHFSIILKCQNKTKFFFIQMCEKATIY